MPARRIPRILIGLALVACAASAGPAGTTASAATAPPKRVLSTWLPYWDGENGLNHVLAHPARFRYVSPFWYAATGAGTIAAHPGAGDPTWAARLHAKGIMIVPSVTAAWKPGDASYIFNTPTLRHKHVATLINLVKTNHYDGIDLDYEGMALNPAGPVLRDKVRTGFTKFVRELCGQLRPQHKRCNVTVMPKTVDSQAYGNWVYDYAALGQAASRVRLMVYNQHGPWGPPGPVASITWADAVLHYATSVIPRKRIEFAVPTYGYHWSGSGTTTSVMWDSARALLEQHHAAIHYSLTHQAPMFTYRANGYKHTVWFENPRSIGAKVRLANRYGVGTMGFWYIGHESPDTWPELWRLTI